MRTPSIRVLKHTASHREKRISTANKPYDPIAWRYDEMGMPKPPVGEAEMRRAHVVPLSTSNSMRRLTKAVSPPGPSWQGPYGAAESSNSSKTSVDSTPGSSLRAQGSGDVPAGPSTLAPQPAVEVGSRDVSAPEDLQIVRALRAEVLRLQQGLPSHQQSSLEAENTRLEKECKGLRRRVEGYQLTIEQFGRRMAEMEAENVMLKVQVETMHKQQAANAVAVADSGDEPSAALLDELSELLRSERRKSRISRGELPPRFLPENAEGGDARVPRASQSPSELLLSMRRANAVLEAELRGGAPEAGSPQRSPFLMTSAGAPLPEQSRGEAREGRQSRAEQQKDGASKDSASRPAGGSEPRAEPTSAGVRLAAADRAELRLRELEAELKQTKMAEVAEKMRQIESKLNESLGKVAKPKRSFDALSLDAQLEELGLCGGEHSPERVD